MEEYERAIKGLEELERSLREQETRENQKEEERSRWEIKKKFAAKADEKDNDAAGWQTAIQAKQVDWKLTTCVYCKSSEHRLVVIKD